MTKTSSDKIIITVGALLASVFIFIFIVWKFVSTDTFGKQLSNYINKYISQHTEVSIRYDKVSVKLFPPGIRFDNLEIISLKPLGDVKSLKTKIKQLDVDAKLLTLTFNKLQISNVEFSGLEVESEIDLSKQKDKEKVDYKKYWNFNFLKNILNLGPVEIFRIGVNDSKVRTNLFDADLVLLSWEKYRNDIEFETDITKINLKNEFLEEIIPNNKKISDQMSLFSSAQIRTELSEKKIKITKVKIGIEDQAITGKSEVTLPFELDKLNYTGELNAFIQKEQTEKNENGIIKKYLNDFGVWSIHSEHNFKLIGNVKSFTIAGMSDAKQIKSSYGSYKSIKVGWLLENANLAISGIEIVDNANGEAKTKNTDIRIDFENMNIQNFVAEIDVKNIDITNGLSILPAVSKSLIGFANGSFLLGWNFEKKVVEVTSKNKAHINGFKLVTNTKNELLSVNNLVLNDLEFSIGSTFAFDGEMYIGENAIEFNGAINKDTINVKTNEFKIDLLQLKSIAGISVDGKGLMSIVAEGDTKNPKLKFMLNNIQHANIFGFYLGDLNATIIVDFLRKAIFLDNVVSKLSSGALKGDGYISLEDFNCDIAIKATGLSTYDLISVHKRLLPWNLSILEKGISTSNINYKISGKINSLQHVQVKADIFMQRFTLASEEIYDLKSSLFFKDKILAMPDISFKKGKGSIAGGLSLDLNDSVFRIAFKSKNLEASDLLFYNYVKPSFNSTIQLEGAYKSTKVTSEGVFNIISTNARLNDEVIDDSYVALQWKDGIAKVQGKYAANWIKLNSLVDFNQSIHDAANKSFITASVNVPNWGKILSIFSSFDNDDPVLSGNLNLEIDSLFNYNRIHYADVELWIKSLNLSHPSLQVTKTSSDRIIIQNGEIKKWDIKIKGLGRDQLISRASGHIAKFADIESIFDFSLGKLNYFLGTYLDLNGFIQSQLKIRISPNSYTYLGKIRSNDTILNTKSLVTTLGKTKFLVEFDNKETRLVSWQSQMGTGYLNANGNINWENSIYPSVSFRYNLNNAKVQLATRSMTRLNGQGLILGTQPPYIINGDIKLSDSEILNEPGEFEFTKNNKQSSVRHLPAQQKNSKTELFVFNINISTETPIAIRNSIAELNLLANLNLQGKLSDPRLAGLVSVKSDRKNIFILKNNQFKVNRLNLGFEQRQEITNPSLDIDAESFISNYVVRAKIYGTVKNHQLDLYSDPVLQRQSILSLIAFGYADNMSQNMSNEDREALSSAGLGAFIFDQLKLNERLHSNLGLTLNVGTEYLATSNSLLQGRTQQSGGGVVGQVRTATKLELRKKIDEKVGLSVSSTVGGSAGQKQSMNLNYLLNRNVSLDAVYELNTDVSENQERAGRSAGGDIKFRWTFK